MQFYKNLVFIVGAAMLLFGASREEITITPSGTALRLECRKGNIMIQRNNQDNTTIPSSSLTIQKVTDENTAFYKCTDASETTLLFIRACLNCVEVEPGTMAGMVIGDLVATFLIAVAVYCVSIPPKVKIHRASDRQALVKNDATAALYSGLRSEDRQEYSRLKPKSKQ